MMDNSIKIKKINEIFDYFINERYQTKTKK